MLRDFTMKSSVPDMDISSKYHIPLILIIISFIIYLSTICPTVYLGDSGELTVAAYSLGIPHPSGYPLYALIGKLFCLVPIGNIGFRMNLMSVFFSLATVWIVYSIIYKITSSIASSVLGAFTLAFTPLFWLQTVSAEVYPLHTFFVALLIMILIYWYEKRDSCYLALFAFIAGLSFLNHLQTLMLAPSVLFLLIASDRNGFLNLKTFTFLSILFLFALTVYVYLPIRTNAGAAIHWGDPDNLKNFIDVVSGKHHRSEYVFNMSFMKYILRSKDALMVVVKQFWMVLLFAAWGFLRLPLMSWRIFYLGIIVFDFFYTVFLNTVNIEITPFNLSTLVVIAILAGLGVSDILKRCKQIYLRSNIWLYKVSNIACCIVPVIFLVSNHKICDQSRNYIAYEHALNNFRTINNGGILIVGADNNLFPITYTRIIERMREDVTLYDTYNLFFRKPYTAENEEPLILDEERDDSMTVLSIKAIEENISRGIYFSLLNPRIVNMPYGYGLIPYGILSLIVNDQIEIDQKKRAQIWNYYASESLEDTFFRDYMNREIKANYHLNKGQHLLMLGGIEPGLRRLKLASEIGYNSGPTHSYLSLLLSDFGFFEEAKLELEKSLIYTQNPAGVYFNWCYYYSKRGDLNNAINSIKKALDIEPNNALYFNYLGSILLEAGRKDEAIEVFRKSLSIKDNQEGIKKLLQENAIKNGDAE
jgi:tetratricopeptide (TPR) repeat protein